MKRARWAIVMIVFGWAVFESNEWMDGLDAPDRTRRTPPQCDALPILVSLFFFRDFHASSSSYYYRHHPLSPPQAAAPKLTHAVLVASVHDASIRRLALACTGSERTARLALLTYLASWFAFFCATRTYSNGVEALLMTQGLGAAIDNRMPALACIGGLSAVIRPSSIVNYLPLGVAVIVREARQAAAGGGGGGGGARRQRAAAARRVGLMVLVAMLWVVPPVALCVLADRVFYGRWVGTALNFIRVNVAENVAAEYGVHPWHW